MPGRVMQTLIEAEPGRQYYIPTNQTQHAISLQKLKF